MSFNGILMKKNNEGNGNKIYFTGWSSWNKDLSSDNLLIQLKIL